MTDRRPVYFISDGTGITAEALGHSLLSQFEEIEFSQKVVPFVSTMEKAEQCRTELQDLFARTGRRPIVFTTLVNSEVREVIRQSSALMLDFFENFIGPLEFELGKRSTHTVGRSHGATDRKEYQERIDAINFALAHDDGVSNRDLDKADVILVGVSRSGKTPTCLYLALQFGVKAANYPLIPEDFERGDLPGALLPVRTKLFGLTIGADRLSEIRNERRPESRYASLDNCRREVVLAEQLMARYGIPSLNSTTLSIEELSTRIIQAGQINRRAF